MSDEPCMAQTVVDTLYLLTKTNGYVPREVMEQMLYEVASPHVHEAIRLLEDARRAEQERYEAMRAGVTE